MLLIDVSWLSELAFTYIYSLSLHLHSLESYKTLEQKFIF